MSSSHSTAPLMPVAVMCEGCRFTRSPNSTSDLRVSTRYRGMTRVSLHPADAQVPLDVLRVQDRADDRAEHDQTSDRTHSATASYRDRHVQCPPVNGCCCQPGVNAMRDACGAPPPPPHRVPPPPPTCREA